MSVFTSIWEGLKGGLEAILRLYEGLLEPIFGQYAWGLGIILLTLTVRLFLVPLAIRQTKSMRNMQKIQPEMKKIQKKYAADRSMMKTDPERYKAMKEKQREAQMALYSEHGVNPVGGCLPLILQMPIFFALFSILRPDGNGVSQILELEGAPFLGVDSLTGTAAAGVGIGAIVLVALQVGTTYYSTKQMQGRNTQAAAEQQQAQKLMLYIMPVFLGYLSWTFPIGVVLYWVTTNIWTIGQQAFIFRSAEAAEARLADEQSEARDTARARRRTRNTGAPSGDKGAETTDDSASTGEKSPEETGSGGRRSGRGSGGSGGQNRASGNGRAKNTGTNGRATNGSNQSGTNGSGSPKRGPAKGSPAKGGSGSSKGSSAKGGSAKGGSAKGGSAKGGSGKGGTAKRAPSRGAPSTDSTSKDSTSKGNTPDSGGDTDSTGKSRRT